MGRHQTLAAETGWIRLRERAYNQVVANSQFEASLIKLEEVFDDARKAMPPAAEGCRGCHYLLGL